MVSKEIMDEFDQCIKCGLCLATCPVCKELLLEKYTPRGKVQLARYYSEGKLQLSDRLREIFSECLLCGACSVTCPSGVDLKKVFLEMRARITQEWGAHPRMEEFLQALVSTHNISREDNEERGDWREFLRNLPDHRYEKEKARTVYFVGCVASFYPMVQTIPQNFVKILEAADVDFTILGGEEWCCGFPLIGAGAPGLAADLIEHNLERVSQLGAREVVFACPSCYCTWKEYYDTELELFHSTQFMEKLISDGSIRFHKLNVTVTYHDPCDLGRNGGVYDAPRRILRSIPGLRLVELERNRAGSLCCGGGGTLEMSDPSLSAGIAKRKIEQIQRSGAETVITSCQQCVRTIGSQARRQKVNLKVSDITELVLTAMERPGW